MRIRLITSLIFVANTLNFNNFSYQSYGYLSIDVKYFHFYENKILPKLLMKRFIADYKMIDYIMDDETDEDAMSDNDDALIEPICPKLKKVTCTMLLRFCVNTCNSINEKIFTKHR